MEPFQPEHQKIIQEVVNNLQQLTKKTEDNLIINGIIDAINKLNKLIATKEFAKLETKELKYKEGKYIGQVLNGLAEGRGTCIFNNGNKYEGYCKQGKAEGRGTKHWNNGDRYEGEYKNDK